MIKFNQKAWLKFYVDKKTWILKNSKNLLMWRMKKKNIKPINNKVFDKTKEWVKKHRGIKISIEDKITNDLAWKPNYHLTKWF